MAEFNPLLGLFGGLFSCLASIFLVKPVTKQRSVTQVYLVSITLNTLFWLLALKPPYAFSNQLALTVALTFLAATYPARGIIRRFQQLETDRLQRKRS